LPLVAAFNAQQQLQFSDPSGSADWLLDNAMRDGGLPKLVGWKVGPGAGYLHRLIRTGAISWPDAFSSGPDHVE